jgi:hypothetical protein
MVLALMTGATVHAAPVVDALLCQRIDDRFEGEKHPYLSVERPAGPTVTANEDGKVTVCKDAETRRCTTFTAKDPGAKYAINADGTLLIASGKKLAIVDAATGKHKRAIANQRRGENGGGAMYSCGGGLWLGDTILAFGDDCMEFDALPYLASARTGKFIAPLVDKQFTTTEETVFDAAPLEGKRWAVAVYNHDADAASAGIGQVFVIDASTGRVLATARGTQAGGAEITEGKATRSIAKLAACSR